MKSCERTNPWRQKGRFLLRYAYCGVRLPRIMLLAPLSKAGRAFLKDLSVLLGWPYPKPPAAIAKIPLDEVLPEGGACRILAPVAANGNISLLELLCIAGLVTRHRPKRLFEIGTFDGRTSLNLIANAPQDARLWTLDLPPQDVENTVYRLDEGEKAFVRKIQSGSRFLSDPHRDRIVQIYADSGQYDPGELAGTMDMVFVDGSHTYDYVLSDTRLALRLLGRSGVIIWHDYDSVWPDVTDALNGVYRDETRLNSLRSIEGTSLAFAVVSPEAPGRKTT